jgi:hypothetical protein
MLQRCAGLQPEVKLKPVAGSYGWVNAKKTKAIVKTKLDWALGVSAEQGANIAKTVAPHGTGAGKSWINAGRIGTPDRPQHAFGILTTGSDGVIGNVPGYMGMIEKGITPHKVSLKHYGLRKWFKRTFGTAEEQPSASGKYRSVMVWKATTVAGQWLRQAMPGGKVGIPWLTWAIKRVKPYLLSRLREAAAA